MINQVTSPISANTHKPSSKTPVSFTGDKDILVADHRSDKIQGTINFLQNALNDTSGDVYNYHKANSGKEALKIAEEIKPALTVSCYNYSDINPRKLFDKLHKLGSRVLVYSSTFYDRGDRSRKQGINVIEKKCGADKYVYGGGYTDSRDKRMLAASVKALMNNKKPPEYKFPYDDAKTDINSYLNQDQLDPIQDSNPIQDSDQTDSQSPVAKLLQFLRRN